MNEAKHSPLPWAQCGAKENGRPCRCGLIWAADGETCIGSISFMQCDIMGHGDNAPPRDVADANRELMLTAVNAHHALTAERDRLAADRERLLAALKGVLPEVMRLWLIERNAYDHATPEYTRLADIALAAQTAIRQAEQQ